MTYNNETYKFIETEDGITCGVIAFHQHGDLIAVGASKVRPKIINTEEFKFSEDKGKQLADKRANKAFERFLRGQASDDPSMLIVNLKENSVHTHLSKVVESATAFDFEDEETNRKQLGLYI